jgi:plastocyanin
MQKKSLLLGIAFFGAATVACGGGGDGGPQAGGGGAECRPSGTTLQITAKNTQFDKDCLAAPADTAFTIEFANEDQGLLHNVAISNGGEHTFHGETITGPKTTTYRVSAMTAGQYKFVCDVHPAQMSGSLVVA